MRTALAMLLLATLACSQTRQRAVDPPTPVAIVPIRGASSPVAEAESDMKMPDPITWDASPTGPVRITTTLPVWSEEEREAANRPSKYLFVDGHSVEGDILTIDCRLVQESPQHWLKRGFTYLVVAQFDAAGGKLCETLETCGFDSQDYAEKHVAVRSFSLEIRADTAAVSVCHFYYGCVGPIAVQRPKKSSR